MPQALTGLRLSVVASLLALVVGEQINANAGLGFMITTAQEFLENNIIMVCLIVYAILGLTADALVRALERKPWYGVATSCGERAGGRRLAAIGSHRLGAGAAAFVRRPGSA